MASQTKLRGSSLKSFFNPAPPSVMHIDINSAFASIEQQANPLLRHTPLVVASSTRHFGCVLAASREAKLWKLRTGMTVAQASQLCPFLVVRRADPDKYRHIHQSIRAILNTYSDTVIPKSIDEFVITFPHSPSRSDLVGYAQEIQSRIKDEVGEWITVSVGISTNRFLAKLASDLKHSSPFIIDNSNYLEVYQGITLTDFTGISHRLTERLKEQGIYTPTNFFRTSQNSLRSAFRSVLSHDWYLNLRGWEPKSQVVAPRKSFGQSYVLPHPMDRDDWLPIMHKLIHKATTRLRSAGYSTRTTHLHLRYQDGTSYRKGVSLANPLFDNLSLTHALQALIPPSSIPVKKVAISFSNLSPLDSCQHSLLTNTVHTLALTHAIDQVNTRFGNYSLHSAALLGANTHVHDTIAFGK